MVISRPLDFHLPALDACGVQSCRRRKNEGDEIARPQSSGKLQLKSWRIQQEQRRIKWFIGLWWNVFEPFPYPTDLYTYLAFLASDFNSSPLPVKSLCIHHLLYVYRSIWESQQHGITELLRPGDNRQAVKGADWQGGILEPLEILRIEIGIQLRNVCTETRQSGNGNRAAKALNSLNPGRVYASIVVDCWRGDWGVKWIITSKDNDEIKNTQRKENASTQTQKKK